MEFVSLLRADLTGAMKSGDKLRVRVIRTLLAAISNAEASGTAPGDPLGDPGLYTGEASPKVLTPVEIETIVAGEIEDCRTAMGEVGAERAEELAAEEAILSEYQTLFHQIDRPRT